MNNNLLNIYHSASAMAQNVKMPAETSKHLQQVRKTKMVSDPVDFSIMENVLISKQSLGMNANQIFELKLKQLEDKIDTTLDGWLDIESGNTSYVLLGSGALSPLHINGGGYYIITDLWNDFINTGSTKSLLILIKLLGKLSKFSSTPTDEQLKLRKEFENMCQGKPISELSKKESLKHLELMMAICHCNYRKIYKKDIQEFFESTVNDYERSENDIRVLNEVLDRIQDFYDRNHILLHEYNFKYDTCGINARADFISEDTIWELKTSKTKYSYRWVLQLIIYYLIYKRESPEECKRIKYLGIFNPIHGTEMRFEIKDIQNEINFIKKIFRKNKNKLRIASYFDITNTDPFDRLNLFLVLYILEVLALGAYLIYRIFPYFVSYFN